MRGYSSVYEVGLITDYPVSWTVFGDDITNGFKTDFDVKGGDSGGPVYYSSNGKLVGIVSADSTNSSIHSTAAYINTQNSQLDWDFS